LVDEENPIETTEKQKEVAYDVEVLTFEPSTLTSDNIIIAANALYEVVTISGELILHQEVGYRLSLL